ncbi:MAG: lycopene cyclase domain-containing protein [Anaerolineales bacterium]
MFGRTTYLIYVLAFCLVPTAIFLAIGFRFIRKNLKVLGLTVLVTFAYLCLTDPLAEAWHNWFFTQDRLLGVYMFNFPVEEGLFFLLVPIAVATATLCFLSFRMSEASG